MEILNKFKSFLTKQSPAAKIIVTNPYQPYSPNRNYTSLADEGYKKNALSKRCIDYIAASVADIQINLFDNRLDTEVTSHALLNLIKWPNPTQSYEEFTKEMISYFMLSGNMYSDCVYGSRQGKEPVELWSKRPDLMSIVPDASGQIYAYVMEFNGKKHTWLVDPIYMTSPVLHVKTFNPLDHFYGLSFIESAAYSVDQYNQAMIWNVSLLKNGARPSGAFVIGTNNDPNYRGLNEKQRAQIREEIDNIYAGAKNAGRPMLLENMTYTEMSLSPKEMDWILSKETSQRDIALAFGVPGQLVGVSGDTTYANYEQARMAFYDNTAIPLAKIWAKALTRWLTPMYKGAENFELRPDIDSIEALAPRRKEKWDMVTNCNFLTVNEKRIETGYGKYEPTDDPADKILVPSGLVPLDFAADFTVEEENVTSNNSTDEANAPVTEEPEEEVEEEDENEDEVESDSEEGKSVQYKAFNLRSNAEKQRYFLMQQKIMLKKEKKLRYQVASHLIREGKKLSEELEGADKLVWGLIADDVLQESSKKLREIFLENMKDTMRTFGLQLIRATKGIDNEIETKVYEENFDEYMSSYIQMYSFEKVTMITGTTRKKLKRLFRDLAKEEDALGAVAVAKSVTTLYKGFTPARSLAIARTETHNAAIQSQLKTAESLNIPEMKKEWISSNDDRSRDGESGPDHVSMDGVKVGMHEQFQVQGSSGVDLMDGPGDPSAPAEQVINCRCVLAFSTGD